MKGMDGLEQYGNPKNTIESYSIDTKNNQSDIYGIKNQILTSRKLVNENKQQYIGELYKKSPQIFTSALLAATSRFN